MILALVIAPLLVIVLLLWRIAWLLAPISREAQREEYTRERRADEIEREWRASARRTAAVVQRGSDQ